MDANIRNFMNGLLTGFNNLVCDKTVAERIQNSCLYKYYVEHSTHGMLQKIMTDKRTFNDLHIDNVNGHLFLGDYDLLFPYYLLVEEKVYDVIEEMIGNNSGEDNCIALAAIWKKDFYVLEILKQTNFFAEYQIDVNIDFKNAGNFHCLKFAIILQLADMVKYLVEAGIDPNHIKIYQTVGKYYCPSVFQYLLSIYPSDDYLVESLLKYLSESRHHFDTADTLDTEKMDYNLFKDLSEYGFDYNKYNERISKQIGMATSEALRQLKRYDFVPDYFIILSYAIYYRNDDIFDYCLSKGVEISQEQLTIIFEKQYISTIMILVKHQVDLSNVVAPDDTKKDTFLENLEKCGMDLRTYIKLAGRWI